MPQSRPIPFDFWRTLSSIRVRMYIKDTEGKFVFINQACADEMRLGDPIEAFGKTDHDYFDDELADKWAEQEALIIETREPMLDQEEKEVWPDGEVKWLVTSKFPLYNDDGNVTGIFGISTDITDRKEKEERDKRELMRYKLAVEGARDGLWHQYRQPKKDVWFSTRWKGMLGYQDAELSNESETFWKLVHPDDRDSVRQTIDRHLEGNAEEYECEYRMRHKSGEYRWIRARGMATFENELATAFAGSHTDITELKKTEQELRESEAFYLTILDTIPGFVFVKDSECRFTFVNKAIAEAFKAPKDDILGKTDDDFLEDKRQVAIFREDDLRVLAGEQLQPREQHEPQEESFRKRRLSTIKVPLLARDGSRGESVHVLGVSTDITDLILARTALEHERDLLHNLMEHSPDAIFFKDTEGRFTRVNKELARIVGKTPRDLVGMTDSDVFDQKHRLNADYAHNAQKHEKEVIDTGCESLNKEAVAWTVDGPRWRQVSKVPVKDREGNVIQIVGISRDITDLKQQTQRFEQLLEHAPHYIFVKDRQYRFLACSKSFAMRHGHQDRKDVKGKTDFDHWAPEVARKFQEDDELVMSTRQPKLNYTEEQPFEDGHKREIETSKIPLYNAAGEVEGLLGVYEDITDRLDREKLHLHQKITQSISHCLKGWITVLEGTAFALKLKHGLTSDISRLTRAIVFLKGATHTAIHLYALENLEQHLEGVLINDLIQDVIDTNPDERIEFLPAPSSPEVLALRSHLPNAILELIANAQDFAPKEGGQIRIWVDVTTRDCSIHIKDNGPGVVPRLKKTLFDLFTKSDDHRTGMGLAYVKMVADSQHGRVAEVGEPGKGAHFVFQLPVKEEKP